jgi:hypothetical protein
MVHHLSLEQLAQPAPRKYKIICGALKTGVSIFCSGNYLFNKIIQMLTKSVWSSIGIIDKDKPLE